MKCSSFYIPTTLLFFHTEFILVDGSTVTYSPDKVEHFEKQTYQELPGRYGKDTGGGKTVDLLTAVVKRFGSLYAFSGSYRI